jgi:ethanolamine utilization protein EutN
MYIGRVSGTVVATIKDPALAARKLLVVDRLTPEGEEDGKYWVAVDSVQAGVGDTVLVIDEGNGARQVLNWEDAPVRAVIVGIVDQVTISPQSPVLSPQTGD